MSRLDEDPDRGGRGGRPARRPRGRRVVLLPQERSQAAGEDHEDDRPWAGAPSTGRTGPRRATPNSFVGYRVDGTAGGRGDRPDRDRPHQRRHGLVHHHGHDRAGCQRDGRSSDPDLRPRPTRQRHQGSRPRIEPLPRGEVRAHRRRSRSRSCPRRARPSATTARGDFTLHGVTKKVEIPIEGRWDGRDVQVVGRLHIVFADYGIQAPTSPVVASIDDQGEMEFQIFFRKA